MQRLSLLGLLGLGCLAAALGWHLSGTWGGRVDLTVQASPAGSVYLNNRYAGLAPVVLRGLPVGEHLLRV